MNGNAPFFIVVGDAEIVFRPMTTSGRIMHGLEGAGRDLANEWSLKKPRKARRTLLCGVPFLMAFESRQMSRESLGDLILRDGAYDLLDDLPVFEDQQGRNAANVIAPCGVDGFVYI